MAVKKILKIPINYIFDITQKKNKKKRMSADQPGNPFFGELSDLYHMVLPIAWTVADLPILVGRYGRRFKFSYRIHSISMSALLLVAYYVIAVQSVNIFLTPGYQKIIDARRNHFISVAGFSAVSLLSAISGNFLEATYVKKNSKASVYKYFIQKMHLFFGIVVWLFVKYSIFTMKNEIRPPWFKFVFFLSVAATPALVAVMEIMNSSIMKDVKLEEVPKGKKLTRYQRLIVSRLRNGETSSTLKADFPDKSIFLYKHKVYDLTGYSHPGGDVIFQNHNFKEISRYVTGTHPDEHLNFPVHNHSLAAFKLLDDHLIGNLLLLDSRNKNKEIYDEESKGVAEELLDHSYASLGNSKVDEDNFEKLAESERKRGDVWTLYNFRKNAKVASNDTWVLSQNEKMSDSLHVLRFKQAKYRVKMALRGVSWIGKHFFITKNKRKPYTTVVCLSKETSSYRESLISYYQKAKKGESLLEESQKLVLPEFSEELCFGVKPYPGRTALSRQICKAKPGEKFIIEGPFGVGIDLKASFSGNCTIIAFGTGILPFLDLFDFLLKKSIYQYFVKNGMEQEARGVKPEQDYLSLYPNARFRLFAAFSNINDFSGKDWIKQLYDVNKQNEMDNFDCKIRLKNASRLGLPILDGRVDKAYFRDVVIGGGQQVDKLLICADVKFMRMIRGWCEELGFPLGRIHFI